MGALLSVACVMACVAWSGRVGGGVGRSSTLLQQQLGAYDSSSKQQELAIIQRALTDEEHGTTPPRVLAEEQEEVAQNQEYDNHKNLASTAVKNAAAKTVAAVKKVLAAKPAAPAKPVAEAPKVVASKVTTKTAFKTAPAKVKPASSPAVNTAALPSAKWAMKEKLVQNLYSKEISLEQVDTQKKVKQLKSQIMQQVVQVLKEGNDKIAKLQSKEKAAETVVKYDKKQADLEDQLKKVQARATAKANALERKLAAVNKLEKKYDSNPRKPLTGDMKAVKEDYIKEDASKQKAMRDKVKAAAYKQSNQDENTVEKQLEETLDREVLSMDTHPEHAKLAKKPATPPATVAATVATSTATTKAAANTAKVAGAKTASVGGSKSGSGHKSATAVKKPVVKEAVTVVKHASRQHTSPQQITAHKARSSSSSSSSSRVQSSVSSSWKDSDSPAAQIMKEISAAAHADDAAAATASRKATKAARATEDAASKKAAVSTSSISTPTATTHTHAMPPALVKAVKHASTHTRTHTAAPTAAPAVTQKESKFEQSVQWAEKHGMPAKLAEDPSKIVQVRQIIGRMKAQAIVQKLEMSIKSDDSFVGSVESMAEKAEK